MASSRGEHAVHPPGGLAPTFAQYSSGFIHPWCRALSIHNPHFEGRFAVRFMGGGRTNGLLDVNPQGVRPFNSL